jgi:hypothetical protein
MELFNWAQPTVLVRPARLGVLDPLGLSAHGRGAGELAPMAPVDSAYQFTAMASDLVAGGGGYSKTRSRGTGFGGSNEERLNRAWLSTEVAGAERRREAEPMVASSGRRVRRTRGTRMKLGEVDT